VAVSIPITTTFDRKGVEQAQAEMAKLSGAVTDTQKKISKQAKLLGAAVGAAAVGIGVAGTMAFVDFERSMNEVFTLVPGTSQQAMDAMTNDVKNFSKEFGVLPDKVVPALYQALSAGVPSGNVFEFLEVAQKAAKGGVTDLTTAVNGISSVMNAYGADTINATQASDLMFTAVRMGKTTFEEMSSALFQVTPTAAALGVKFGDVTAALASMTAQGVPTSVATTQLRQLFVELSKEGTKTSDVFEKISGKSFKQFVAEGGNTQQALQMLEKHAADTGVGVNDLFGSVEAGSAALSLTGKGTETFTKNLGEMSKSAGATEGAFGQMDQGLGPLIDKFKAWAAVLLIDIGTKLAPIIEKVVGWFDKHRVAAYALAGIVGGVLLVALAAYIASMAAAAVATIAATWPILAVVAAIAAVVAAIVFLWTNWDQVWKWISEHKAIAAIIAIMAGPILIPIFALVAAGKFLYANWKTIWSGIQKAVAVAWSVLQTIWSALRTALSAVWGAMQFLWDVVQNVWSGILKAINAAWSVIQVIWSAIQIGIGIIIAYYQLLWKVVQTVWSGILTAINAAWSVIKVIWGAIQIGINVVISYYMLLWRVVQVVWNAITGAINTAWNIIKGAFFNIISGIATVWGFFQTAKDIIGSVFSNIADAISGPFRTAFNFISDAWNNTIGNLSWTIPSWVPGGLGGKSISAPKLPRFENGGFFNTGMGGGSGLAVLHDNEMILNPQQQKALFSGNGLGGGPAINVTINTVAGDPDAIERIVIDAIARASRRGATVLVP
jgi:TP901 family phage tail tape measure protein